MTMFLRKEEFSDVSRNWPIAFCYRIKKERRAGCSGSWIVKPETRLRRYGLGGKSVNLQDREAVISSPHDFIM